MKITHTLLLLELGSQVPGMIYRLLETLIQIALITLKAILLNTAGCGDPIIQISASTTIVIQELSTFQGSDRAQRFPTTYALHLPWQQRIATAVASRHV
jgi:hypothetical protein